MSPYPTLFNVPRPAQPPDQPAGVTVLPLNLLALIISHLENVADLARVCQTSRVLHYMTLPQLYKNITLISYEHIRYKDDQAEGIGSSSPFSMGLNALVTRNVCALVRTLALRGHWKEHDLDEYSRAGRVPDDAMMLNIGVRAAVDRCTLLEGFKWDLNTKMLPNVYAGLASLQHLRSFHLRFPSIRSPRPTAEIPPMLHLRSFTMTDYDPLCFPDDISTLLLRATKLRTLKMHFSPRMRDAGEPSVHLHTFFRKNIAAKQKLKLQTFQLYNLFAQQQPEVAEAVDPSGIRHVTFLNTFGIGEEDGPSASNSSREGFLAFFDNTWLNPPKEIVNLKSQRHDRLSRLQAKLIGSMVGLEALYLVNARHRPHAPNGNPNGVTGGQPGPSPASTNSSSTALTPPASSSSRSTPNPNTSLRDAYIDAVCLQGSTLKHLIMPARWQLPTSVLARMFRACPHLTQLAVSMEYNSFESMRMLVPFLTKLWAIRILTPQCSAVKDEEQRRAFNGHLGIEDPKHERFMSTELAKGNDFPELRYVGLGTGIWEVGGVYESVETVEEEGENGEQIEREEVVLRRRLRKVTPDEVRDVEIWTMDTLDVV